MSMYGPYVGHVIKDQHARITADVARTRSGRGRRGSIRLASAGLAGRIVAGRGGRLTSRAAGRLTTLGSEGAR